MTTRPSSQSPQSTHRHAVFTYGLLIMLASCLMVTPVRAEEPGVVFHIDSDAHMNRSLRQISRHLEAHPDIPLRVVLIASGVNPALEGAEDPNGGLYSAQMEQLLAKGVRIFACENTLNSFNKSPDDLTFGIETVESGVAELGRLQIQLDYAYIKL